MTRQEKLKSLKNKQHLKDASNPKVFIEALQFNFKQLESILEQGTEVKNIDQLLVKLEQVNGLRYIVKELNESIKAIPAVPGVIKIDNINTLVRAMEALAKKKEVVVEEIDQKPFVEVSKKMDKLIAQIKANKVEKPSQLPEDYLPMRRVVKVEGVGLLFDDSFYTGGGGGGISELPAEYPLPDSQITDLLTPTPYTTLMDDTTTTDVTYVGKAAPGTNTSAASWQILKIDETGSYATFKYAGSGLFNQVFDNRVGLTYA